MEEEVVALGEEEMRWLSARFLNSLERTSSTVATLPSTAPNAQATASLAVKRTSSESEMACTPSKLSHRGCTSAASGHP